MTVFQAIRPKANIDCASVTFYRFKKRSNQSSLLIDSFFENVARTQRLLQIYE